MTTPPVPPNPDRRTPATASTVDAPRHRRAAGEPLRRALLTLHGELLEEQRRSAERFGGRMSAGEVLQAATVDLRFSWLGTLSALMAELDAGRGDEDETSNAATVDRLRALLVAPDPATSFGMRYLRALQDHPAVVFAHRDVVAALPTARAAT